MTRDHDPHDAAHDGTHDGAKAPAQAQTPDERLRALLGDGLDGVDVTPEEKAAAKLTAHALGELSTEEAAEIERRLALQASARVNEPRKNPLSTAAVALLLQMFRANVDPLFYFYVLIRAYYKTHIRPK